LKLTLIITELSGLTTELGIAMAADTAQTIGSMNVRGLVDDRAFFGLTKLLPVTKLQAGISYWGWAKMPPSSKNGVWMDWWLKHFLVKNTSNYNSIRELAELLEKELRKLIPRLTEEEFKLMEGGNGGIHLAGFVDEGEEKVPCFWHIHNGVSQALPEKEIDPHIVNANYDCPPETFRKYGWYQTTNGDYEPYARFFRKYLINYLAELRKEMGYIIPIPTTDFSADFLRTQIKFISGLYAVGGILDGGSIKQLARGIGGNVTTLTITKDGIQSYKEF
jgi:hypothetical protein